MLSGEGDGSDASAVGIRLSLRRKVERGAGRKGLADVDKSVGWGSLS